MFRQSSVADCVAEVCVHRRTQAGPILNPHRFPAELLSGIQSQNSSDAINFSAVDPGSSKALVPVLNEKRRLLAVLVCNCNQTSLNYQIVPVVFRSFPQTYTNVECVFHSVAA